MRTTFNRFALTALMNEVGTDAGAAAGAAGVAPKSPRELLVEKANDLAAKYNAVLAKIADIDAKAAAEAKLAGISAGDRVDAQVGKGEKAQQIVNAEVIGVAEVAGKGKQIKVVTGSGFDTQVYVLSATQILNVITADEIAAAVTHTPAPEVEQAAE